MGRVLLCLVAALFLCAGCAQERPLKDIIPDGRRVLKSDLSGIYVYLRAISEVKFAADAKDPFAPGQYLDSDKLVQFRINERTLDVVSIDPLYREDRPIEANNILLSFPVRHVDVLRKQNVDGEDTHEVEETETRRVWSDRSYIVIDTARNLVDTFKEVRTASASDRITVERDAINFSTTKQLSTDAVISETYSFLKFQPESASGYLQREYPRSLQERFGFYKTVAYGFDKFGRMTTTLTREYMNRWNLSKPIVYYFSKDFPEHLKPMAKKVVANWNRAVQAATGRESLELRENTGQMPGDLRYNLIVYDDVSDQLGLMGYGPTASNPRTGELLKGDVFLYGRALKRALYAEREWAKRMKIDVTRPSMLLAQQGLSFNASLVEFTDRISRIATLSLPNPPIATVREVAGNSSAVIENFRREARTSAAKCATSFSPDVMTGIAAVEAASQLTDDQLEIQIFTPLLTHELGHTLGLRHNFMASADVAHFHSSAPSSSVMDYGFLSRFEPISPASYDIAALRVLYGPGGEATQAALDQNYLFCTDEQLYDSRFGLCEPFDSGKTLSEISLNFMRRYLASFYFNNVRSDLFHFGFDSDKYLNRVLSYLVPLRLMIDHAQAIATLGRPLTASPNAWPDLSSKALVQLYGLLRQRIEAPAGAPDAIEIETAPNEKHWIDKAKLRVAVADAVQAKTDALNYLALIINDDDDPRKKNNRPENDEKDPFSTEINIRGVLVDKMLAFATIATRTEDPLGSGKGVSLFYSLHAKVAGLFAGVLSNTESVDGILGNETLTRFKTYHPALRDLANEIVMKLADGNSLESGEIKELLRLEKLRLLDDGTLVGDYRQKRTEHRTILFELENNPPAERKETLEEALQKKRREIDEMNFTVMTVRDGLNLKSQILLPNFGVRSASGLLMRDNVAVIEDRLWVLDQLYAANELMIVNETDPEIIDSLKAKRVDLEERRLDFHRYLETEKSLLESWYRKYSPQ